jgi:pimeloyl-ACP methyl ester carboxylesterase
MSTLRRTEISVPGWRLDATVLRGGSGQPFVWFHGMEEPSLEDPLLNALAERYEVIAPIHPGFRDLDDIRKLRDVHDLALYHDDLLEALRLNGVALGGISFGGMVAAELAAHVPKRVDHLVLAAPMGLWRDDEPTPDPFTAYSSGGLNDLLWSDLDTPAAVRSVDAFANAHDQTDLDVDPAASMMIGMLQGMTTVGKFIWPLPDKGLRRRLHRIRASTLIVWGTKDRFQPAIYAEDFSDGISGARTELLDAGHMAPYEKTDEFVEFVTEHLDRGA